MKQSTFIRLITFLIALLFISALCMLPIGAYKAEEPDISVYIPDTETNPPVKAKVSEVKETKKYYNVSLSINIQDYIFQLCEENNVDPVLIFAMIETESRFNSNCVSRTNDYGLMQINKCNHNWLKKQYGVDNFLDPKQNLLCGISMMAAHLKNNNGDWVRALMCYNQGTTGARKSWARGIYETSYTRKVMSNTIKYMNGEV